MPPCDLRGLIFDMDGTLTVPQIDFPRIRRETGIAPTGDIVLAIEALPPDQQQRAWAIIQRHESIAIRDAALQPGIRDLLRRARAHGLRLALLTRNTIESATTICQRFELEFDPMLTREFPHLKPSPEPVLHICRQWQLPPKQVLMVGDYLHDIQAGASAGAQTCFFRNPGYQDFSHLSDFAVNNAPELVSLLQI